MKKLWFEAALALMCLATITLHLLGEGHAFAELMLSKMVQVNFGLIHAYIAGRILLGKVEWGYTPNFTPKNVGRIVLYAVIVYSYAVGG
ncbi:hypothetical protein [Sulfurospirillum cavolei]|uniref:hypothetical protein n=1 Tax=Sulfurospirillum cavolei TaxID=366522 RepID=UPI0005A92C38|nr:hypothetical protein [Sulfurospirillum cavolei]